MSSGFFILGDQLFAPNHFKKFTNHPVFMAEDYNLCTTHRHHQQKLVLFLSSMREFNANSKLKIEYNKLHNTPSKTAPYTKRLLDFIKKQKLKKIESFEVSDKTFCAELSKFFKKNDIEWIQHPSPAFACPSKTFVKHLKNNKAPTMKSFYESERKRLKILINKDGSPQGGRWSFDKENRKS